MPTLLSFSNLTKSYGTRTVLEGATGSFQDGQKIGVIGRNGAGKSTLFKILTGQEEADGGTFSPSSALRLSYLQQHDPFLKDEVAMDFLTRDTGREEWECAKLAGQFQLDYEKLWLPVTALSGGYQMRVKLTAMLLKEPNFLMLDEPTNYLDLSTLLLLETFLQEFEGGFLVISHDREFLKRTCDQTLEVERGEVTFYEGDVEAYFQYKQEKVAHAERYNKTIEKKQQQLQTFVDRFKAKASKASAAQSKMKQLAKLKTIDIDQPLSSVSIRLPQVPVKKGLGMAAHNLTIGYPDKTIASGINLEIPRGAHVAVLGDNGQGKSTFLKTIAGFLEKKSGSIEWGYDMKVAYYAQHVYGEMDESDTVFEYLESQALDTTPRQAILDMAGSFLFPGDEVKKKIRVLSGGERARMCLAGLLLSGSDVFLLDEPTNHLDFETVEALGDALKNYQGTLFFISHDRTFVHLAATQIIEVKDGNVMGYPGTYDEYVYHLRESLFDSDSGDSKSSNAKSGKSKNAKSKAGKDVQSQIKKISTAIETLEKEKQQIHLFFSNNPTTIDVGRQLRLSELSDELETLEEQWLALQEQAEA
ncbi:MAG: ABC-F family ATP-binding cassette domain-containing protein [Candidatus Margulisiibacteriota bacterium]